LERLDAKEMPPEDAPKQPTADERKPWRSGLEICGRSLPSAMPAIPARAGPAVEQRGVRLHHSRSDGCGYSPHARVPVDPANEAGFDNTGESLSMSPALLKKYLDGARHVSEYLLLKPTELCLRRTRW